MKTCDESLKHYYVDDNNYGRLSNHNSSKTTLRDTFPEVPSDFNPLHPRDGRLIRSLWSDAHDQLKKNMHCGDFCSVFTTRLSRNHHGQHSCSSLPVAHNEYYEDEYPYNDDSYLPNNENTDTDNLEVDKFGMVYRYQYELPTISSMLKAKHPFFVRYRSPPREESSDPEALNQLVNPRRKKNNGTNGKNVSRISLGKEIPKREHKVFRLRRRGNNVTNQERESASDYYEPENKPPKSRRSGNNLINEENDSASDCYESEQEIPKSRKRRNNVTNEENESISNHYGYVRKNLSKRDHAKCSTTNDRYYQLKDNSWKEHDEDLNWKENEFKAILVLKKPPKLSYKNESRYREKHLKGKHDKHTKYIIAKLKLQKNSDKENSNEYFSSSETISSSSNFSSDSCDSDTSSSFSSCSTSRCSSSSSSTGEYTSSHKRKSRRKKKKNKVMILERAV